LRSRRIHSRTHKQQYLDRYSENIASLPGSPRFELERPEERASAAGSSVPASPRSRDPIRGHYNPSANAPSYTTSKAVRESLRFFLDAQERAPERVGVRMHRCKTLLSSESPAEPAPRVSRQSSKLDISSRDQPDVISKGTSVSSSSRMPSRDPSYSSLPSSRAPKQVGRSYMPGCQDSNTALRLGIRSASASKRDLFGRDSFEAGLRC